MKPVKLNPVYSKPELNIDGFIDNIITSYESRVQKIQTAFQSTENIAESSHTLLDNVHHSLNNLKIEREQLNSKLCETLAKNGSIRKKDYHIMMSGILDILDEKEKEAQKQFLNFIESQKENTQKLKNSLLDIKDLATPEASEKISLLKEQLSKSKITQELNKESVIKILTDFQNMHSKIMECLEDMIEKGDHVAIQDIKRIKVQILHEFKFAGNY